MARRRARPAARPMRRSIRVKRLGAKDADRLGVGFGPAAPKRLFVFQELDSSADS
jgi:hypothetical protein